jgi:hypothetical protein
MVIHLVSDSHDDVDPEMAVVADELSRTEGCTLVVVAFGDRVLANPREPRGEARSSSGLAPYQPRAGNLWQMASPFPVERAAYLRSAGWTFDVDERLFFLVNSIEKFHYVQAAISGSPRLRPF